MSSVRILGPIELWAGQKRLRLGGPRQLALLAFLVVHANRAVSVDALSDALWDSDRSPGVKPLHMAIARLRKALEPLGSDGPALRTVGGGYLLSISPDDLDAGIFQAQLRDGQSALDAGHAAHAATLLRGALELWRGPPLADVAFEDFAQAGIRRLEELRLTALETRIDADLQLGEHAELCGELGALAVEYPTRERLVGQLMLALYRCGRQQDALEGLSTEPPPSFARAWTRAGTRAASAATKDFGTSTVSTGSDTRSFRLRG